jgi:hypothetical protein
MRCLDVEIGREKWDFPDFGRTEAKLRWAPLPRTSGCFISIPFLETGSKVRSVERVFSGRGCPRYEMIRISLLHVLNRAKGSQEHYFELDYLGRFG